MLSNLIDSIIATISPQKAVRRQLARKLLRSYQGAESTRFNAHKKPQNRSADQELLGPFGADRMRAWARMLVRDNAYAWGVVDTIVSSVVGCGIHPQSILETINGDDIEEANERRDSAFAEWAEVCDINGQYTFGELQAIAMREMVEAGEVLIRLVRTGSKEFRGIHRPVPLALELIEADRLAIDKDTYQATNSGGNRIVRGVELDELGKPVAYWIYPSNPNDPYRVNPTPVRVPAGEIQHLYRRDRVGQTRGVTWFAPVVQWLRDLGTYVDNELQASAVASCFTVAIKSDSPVGDLFSPDGESATDVDGNSYDYLQPGIIMRLRNGESIESVNPGRPNSASEPWISLMLRGIAVGTGLSYEIVARDYSQTNYSSNRASQLEDRRRFRCWQRYLVNHLCQPVWDAFCEAGAFAGVSGFPTATDLLSSRRRVTAVEWQTPEWEWVDPVAEQNSSQSAIESFMSDYQSEIGSLGRSWRSVFYQRAKEERLRQKLGLKTLAEKQMETAIAATTSKSADVPVPVAAEQDTQQELGAGAPEVNVAGTALNGAQIASLVEVIAQVQQGIIPKDSAKAILAASFPMVSQAIINSIIDPVESLSAQPTDADGNVIDNSIAGTGELMNMTRLQWNRNNKAMMDILDGLQSGTMTAARATVMLSALGFSQQNIEMLIDDAMQMKQEVGADGEV